MKYRVLFRDSLARLNLLACVKGFYAIFLFVSALKLFSYAYNILRTPYQLELREGAILSITQLLLNGRIPFTTQSLPVYMNVYGIFYNLLLLPFASLFGNTFFIHRLLTLSFIFTAIGFLIVSLGRNGSSPLFTFTAGVCILANLLYSVSPLARPDGLGFLLYTLASLLPWERGFSRGSLILSAILGTLAFFTKIYFYLGVVYIAVYLFLRVSKKLALAYAALCAGLLLATALVVDLLFPYLFYSTFFLVADGSIFDLNHMLSQFKLFVELYGGLLIALLLLIDWSNLAEFRLSRPRLSWIKEIFIWKQPGQPFLRNELDYPLTALLLATACVALRLGGHTGSKMVYLFQLITPFLVIVFSRLLSQHPKYTLLFTILAGFTVAANLVQIRILPYNLHILPDSLFNNPAQYQGEWDRMEATVRGSRTILNSPLIVGMLIDQNKPFVNNGQTEYFKSVHIPSLFFLPAETDIHAIATNFHNRIEKNIKERRYDKVIIDQEFSPLVSKSLLKKYYHLQEILKLYSIQNRQAFQLEVWLPK